MIFQSLINLYDRLADEMPPYGFSKEDIGFVVTIDREGNMVGRPEDLRKQITSTSYRYKESIVPYTNQVNVRSVSAAKIANFMVDKADYIFGWSGSAGKSVYHDSFQKLIDEVCEKSVDEGIVAVKSFLAQWNPEDSVNIEDWKEICGTHGKWIAFRLAGDRCFVHERPEVKRAWSEYLDKQEFPKGISFVDGEVHDIQSQYAQFKFGSGASLVSFNEAAYESYGKKKGENAPISVEAEFKSSAALKYLFRSRMQRIRIGDATTVFWAQRASPVETLFGQVLDPTAGDEDSIIKVQQFLETIRKGELPSDIERDRDIQFYILGLSLNKARLALRFWHACSVSDLMDKIRDHFDNLEIEHSGNEITYPGIWHMLKETARETKGISPVLGGALTRSILTGERYPQSLFQGVINRIKADHRVTYLRASILKAVLQRNYKMEVPMSLDTERREAPYLLGRLFAVLEKAQLDALGKINATIKDRFFSAASATPASVFPRLLRLSQYHIEKAEYGHLSDRRIAEIMEHIKEFPTHINLQDQGLFAIAYYQQKNALYRKKETVNEGGEK